LATHEGGEERDSVITRERITKNLGRHLSRGGGREFRRDQGSVMPALLQSARGALVPKGGEDGEETIPPKG